MRRPYDIAAYAEVVARARRALPGLALSTDVIVGFPGETDADHEESLAFVEQAGFSRLHVFRYSVRADTPAAAMSGHVAAVLRAERAAAMRAVGESAARREGIARVGSVAELLVERVCPARGGAPLIAEGTTREYLRMRAPVPSAELGDLVPVIVVGADADGTATGSVLR
jgi:threonylcarbamoyladenosine tRNA methylthiotransferase MtaB